MIFSANISVAMANMLANKTRSLFSMLGIVIGTAAVILVISIVNGTRRNVMEQSMNGRENLLRLAARYDEATRKMAEIEPGLIDRVLAIPNVASAYPSVDLQLDVRGSMGQSKASISSVDYKYADFYKLKLVMGRFFSEEETQSRPRACVISDKLAESLFGFDYPIGQNIRSEKGAFNVIGVFKSEERLKRMDISADILLPYKTAMLVGEDPRIYALRIQTQPGKVEDVKNALLAMRLDGRIPDEKIAIVDLRDYQHDVEKWARSWLIQMALVSSISLFVGGIGLMNVMLTTVAERTHEIGLRKALGADSRTVLHQFLVESVTLSATGGLLGIILGTLLTYTVDVMGKGRIYADVLPISLFMSLGFSIVTGVLFGLFPASKAANLSPVEALRYE